MPTYILKNEDIEKFKSSWSCHGLPEYLETIEVDVDNFGNLEDVRMTVIGNNGKPAPFDSSECDGDALKALVNDCIVAEEELGSTVPVASANMM